jgi:cyclase
VETPQLVTQIAGEIGRQSVVVVLDVKKRLLSRDYDIYTHNGRNNTKRSLFALVSQFEELGAGEIVVNSIDNDGRMKGYDLDLARRVKQLAHIPVTFLGGAGSLQDIGALLSNCGIVGAGAGSLFVFKGVYKAVLINYPKPAEKDDLIRASSPD